MAEQGDSLSDVLRRISAQDQAEASMHQLEVMFCAFYRTALAELGNRTDAFLATYAYVAGMFRASRPE